MNYEELYAELTELEKGLKDSVNAVTRLNKKVVKEMESGALTDMKKDLELLLAASDLLRERAEAFDSAATSFDTKEYFASGDFTRQLLDACEERKIDVIGEKGVYEMFPYGEGKTHLLNTIFSIASSENMVVSFVSLGKETPFNKMHLIYHKVIASTYLPGARQPGLRDSIEGITSGSNIAGELLGYSAKTLETDKLYYMLSALFRTQEEDERYSFLQDLEGDFATNAQVRRSYRRVAGTPARFNQNFSKTKHAMDYFYFMSHLIRQLGYNGWILLFDEAELLGRLGKKTRAKCYIEMDRFLRPDPRLESTHAFFAMSSSYVEDVIDRKHEEVNAREIFSDDPQMLKSAEYTIQSIIDAPELSPLSKSEITGILSDIQEFHGRAYDWSPSVSADTLYSETEAAGYLLRTRIRSAIEFLDQLYQYGEAGETRITELGAESYEEDDAPDLSEIGEF